LLRDQRGTAWGSGKGKKLTPGWLGGRPSGKKKEDDRYSISVGRIVGIAVFEGKEKGGGDKNLSHECFPQRGGKKKKRVIETMKKGRGGGLLIRAAKGKGRGCRNFGRQPNRGTPKDRKRKRGKASKERGPERGGEPVIASAGGKKVKR